MQIQVLGDKMCKCDDDDCEYKESKLYWHEALHTASLATDFFQENIELHPAIRHDAELSEEAQKITTMMANFYQKVGRKSHGFDGRG